MKKALFSVIFVCLFFCAYAENEYLEPFRIQYLHGYYPVPNNSVGLDLFLFVEHNNPALPTDYQFRLTENQKHALWQKCLSHQRAAQANMEAAEKQSIMVPDKQKREVISTAIKSLVTSMTGRTLKEKAFAIATILAAEYLASIYEQYDKIQVYLAGAEEQYRLAGQCLDVLGCE